MCIQGFIVFDYRNRYDKAQTTLSECRADGKLKYRVDVVQGLENARLRLTSCLTARTAASSLCRSPTDRRDWLSAQESGQHACLTQTYSNRTSSGYTVC